MMDATMRDAMVGFLKADKRRVEVVRTLERKGTSLSTNFFCKMFWPMREEKVIELLREISAHGIIEVVFYRKDYPESWDLTIEGHEILNAL